MNLVVNLSWRLLLYWLGAISLFAIFGWTGAASSAPITFNTALPVAEGEFIAREQFGLNQSGDDPSGADRDRTAWSVVSVLVYGVNSDLALFGVVPYVNKQLKLTTDGARVRRRTNGLGDIKLFGRYTIFKNNFSGGNFRIAPFAGIEVPTADNKRSDALGRLPASVQPGSGSWDPFGGIVITYQTLDFEIDAQASYKANTEANGFEFGDVARLDGSLQYRLWPRELSGGVPGFLYGVLEANLIREDKDGISDIKDPNSGGTRLFLVPGLQYVTRRWIAETSVQFPIVQDLNGTKLENDYIVRTGFRLNF